MKMPGQSHRASFKAGLLSLLLLWCTGFAPLPAQATTDTAIPAHSGCIACNPLSGAPHHGSSASCIALPNAVKDNLTPSVDFSLDQAAPHSIVVFERVDFALPRATTRRPFAAPPLYLSLRRLLN